MFDQWCSDFIKKEFYHVPYITKKSGKSGLVKISRVAVANYCARGYTFKDAVQAALKDHLARLVARGKRPTSHPLPRTDLPKVKGEKYKQWELENPTNNDLRKLRSITKHFVHKEDSLVVVDNLSYGVISKLQEHLPRGVFK